MADQLFSIANLVALAGWVLLILLPRRSWVARTVIVAIVLLFASAYGAIIAARWAGRSGGFSSLPAVAALFADPWLLLAGWIHYLAFDLLVGRWETIDAQNRGIPHLAVVPCLFLTFMFGPAGWLAYVTLRAVHARSIATKPFSAPQQPA